MEVGGRLGVRKEHLRHTLPFFKASRAVLSVPEIACKIKSFSPKQS